MIRQVCFRVSDYVYACTRTRARGAEEEQQGADIG